MPKLTLWLRTLVYTTLCFLGMFSVCVLIAPAGIHGHNSEECAVAGSHWDLSMIVKRPGGTFLSL